MIWYCRHDQGPAAHLGSEQGNLSASLRIASAPWDLWPVPTPTEIRIVYPMNSANARLRQLVDEIDEAANDGELEDRVTELIGVVGSSDDETLEGWLDSEVSEIEKAPQPQPGPLTPSAAAALLRAQAVTKALGLASTAVKKGVGKVRNLLNKWIGKIQNWLVSTVKQQYQAAEVSLEVQLGRVSVGVTWT